MSTGADLYEDDFYLWTQAQAEAPRAAARAGGRSNTVDWERVAEEVGDLGKSDLRACISLTARILEHLLLLDASARPEPKGHWRKENRGFRRDLLLTLTPSLRQKVEARIAALHQDTRLAVLDELATIEPSASVDPTVQWTLAEILGEVDDPLKPA